MSTERPNWIDQEIDKNKKRDELFRKFVHELKTEDRYQNYLKQFSDHSVESFINSYASSKATWHHSGDDNLQTIQYFKDKWLEYAIECIGFILNKKLFDLQCAWRSEKIKIEGVNFFYLFALWEHDVFRCPFVEPVTTEEIELFTQFLKESPIEQPYWTFCEGQEYENIKAYYTHGTRTRQLEGYEGSWYDFHSREMGTDLFLITQPDLRGPKEDFYTKLVRNEEKLKEIQSIKSSPSSNSLPRINILDEEFLERFVKQFDTKESYRLYMEEKTWYSSSREEKNVKINDALDLLYMAKRLVPIEQNDDWRDGIKCATERYTREMIIEALPDAMRAYQEYLKTGAPLLGMTDRDQLVFRNNMIQRFEERILRGRELNGEPRDFNF